MLAWSHFVQRRRALIATAWVLISLVGFSLSSSLNSHLSSSLDVPNTSSATANQLLHKTFGENIEGAFTVIFNFKQGTEEDIAQFEKSISDAAQEVPGVTVTQQRALGGVILASLQTEKKLMDASALTADIRTALNRHGLSKALVTGAPALASDIKPILNDDLHRGQTLAILLATIFLIAVLGLSWSVLIPFITAAASIGGSILLLRLFSTKTLIVMYTPNVVELIALGLAIDYSLLLIQRYRTELSVDAMMKSAGRTVLLSGVTVALGISTLMAIPVPFIRSLGVAGLLVPLLSLVASVSLTPALIAIFGPRLVRPLIIRGLLTRDAESGDLWERLMDRVLGAPKKVLTLTLLPLLAIASLSLGLSLTPSSTFAMPQELESSRALTLLGETGGPGAITPHEILIDLGAPGRASDALVTSARIALASALSNDSESFMVVTGKKSPLVDPTGRYLRIFVIGRHELGADETKRFVAKLRSSYIPENTFPAQTKIYLAGSPAQGVDYIHVAYSSFAWVALAIFLLVLFLLRFVLKNWVLPLLTAGLNLLTVAIAYASLVAIFMWGWGSHLFGTYRVNQIEAWVPIFLFAVLFGLSMDYQLFIVMRMAEGRVTGLAPLEAIRHGVVRTGAVVTSAAVILISAVSGLIFGHIAGLQELGVGLAVGVLIDVVVIRSMLLPAAMALLESRALPDINASGN